MQFYVKLFLLTGILLISSIPIFSQEGTLPGTVLLGILEKQDKTALEKFVAQHAEYLRNNQDSQLWYYILNKIKIDVPYYRPFRPFIQILLQNGLKPIAGDKNKPWGALCELYGKIKEVPASSSQRPAIMNDLAGIVQDLKARGDECSLEQYEEAIKEIEVLAMPEKQLEYLNSKINEKYNDLEPKSRSAFAKQDFSFTIISSSDDIYELFKQSVQIIIDAQKLQEKNNVNIQAKILFENLQRILDLIRPYVGKLKMFKNLLELRQKLIQEAPIFAPYAQQLETYNLLDDLNVQIKDIIERVEKAQHNQNNIDRMFGEGGQRTYEKGRDKLLLTLAEPFEKATQVLTSAIQQAQNKEDFKEQRSNLLNSFARILKFLEDHPGTPGLAKFTQLQQNLTRTLHTIKQEEEKHAGEEEEKKRTSELSEIQTTLEKEQALQKEAIKHYDQNAIEFFTKKTFADLLK